ncbi:MAG: hypothetical protein ACPLYF_05280 [Fervidobacterium sp.]
MRKLGVIIIVLLVFSYLTLFITLSTAPAYAISINTWIGKVYDECGNPRVNPDGTYYPGDAFKIGYDVTLGVNETFLGLVVSYDKNTFKASKSGNEWFFEILKSARPGTYKITFTAYANYTYMEGNETRWRIVSSSSSQEVRIVKYEPRFTVLLNYTLYKDEHSLEYEKPFVIIVRYDGNGPTNNTNERAIIDNYTYKITGIHYNITFKPNPNLTTTVINGTTYYIPVNATTIIKHTREYPDASLSLWNKTTCLIFDSKRRYARLVLSSNDTLRIVKDGYEYIQVNMTFYTARFSAQPYTDFNTTHTYMPRVFKKLIRITAYEPYKVPDTSPNRIDFRIDRNVRIRMIVVPMNTSLTYPELLMLYAKNETNDETALQYFQNDLYKNTTQVFDTVGELNAFINRTAIDDLYNYTIIIQNPNTNIEVHDITILPFDNKTLNVYVNFIGYGVDVKNITATQTQVTLKLFVRNESGGLKWIAVRTRDKVIENITLPFTPWFISERGFVGNLTITFPNTNPPYTQVFLEYRNVWNATTLDGPYTVPQPNVTYAGQVSLEYWVALLFFAYILMRIIVGKLKKD